LYYKNVSLLFVQFREFRSYRDGVTESPWLANRPDVFASAGGTPFGQITKPLRIGRKQWKDG